MNEIELDLGKTKEIVNLFRTLNPKTDIFIKDNMGTTRNIIIHRELRENVLELSLLSYSKYKLSRNQASHFVKLKIHKFLNMLYRNRSKTLLMIDFISILDFWNVTVQNLKDKKIIVIEKNYK